MEQEKENNKGIDLSKAFDEVDTKYPEETKSSEYVFYPGTPKAIQWLVKYSGGLIKNESQATYVLIGFVILVMIISFILVFSGKNSNIAGEVPVGQIVP